MVHGSKIFRDYKLVIVERATMGALLVTEQQHDTLVVTTHLCEW